MEDYAKSILRKVCCTCLSIDRKLIQLYKLKDGVNNLFFLVSADSEAYESMFRRDVTQLFICWECEAFMRRQRRFIDRVCVAQKQLSQIVDGQTDLKPLYNLSRLIRVHNNSYDKEFVYADSTIDNFIDCGPNINIDIKTESSIALIDIDHEISSVSDEELTTIDEIKVLENKLEIKPLSINKRKSKNVINKRGRVKRKDDNEESIKEAESELKDVTELLCNKTEDEPLDNNRKLNNETVLEKKIEIESLLKKRKVKKEEEFIKEDGFCRIRMTEEELLESIEKRKLENDFVLASNKCESCVEAFKNHTDLEEHNSRLHLQKPKFIQCDICLVYFKFWWLAEHREEHYLKYQCSLCTQVSYTVMDILLHLKNVHQMRNALTPIMMRKLKRRAMQTKPDLAKRSDASEVNEQTKGESPSGFKCSDCDKCFENLYLRYKHTLKVHREGHKCATCGKTFAFKNTLNKHVQIHGEPQPTQQCPVCGKMVRRERAAAHARIHGARAALLCVACDKRFVSRDSYEKHLKYSSRHAVTDVHKYKCTMCDKGFRTTRELNDHANYNHMGKTHYKCPICHKALATRRSVTRHVSRAHHGIKEKSGDKILCQTCGKAFRDKKCLREHELIHTGEKPLSCDMCGRTFRQSACLYTHRRRVHKVAPKRLCVQHAGPDDERQEKNEIN